MILKVKDAVFLYDTIASIANKDDINEVPVDVKFILVRNIRALQQIWEDFYATRQKLVIDNSEPNPEATKDTEDRKVTRLQLDFINSEIEKLENVEMEVTVLPLTLDQLDSLHLDITEMNGLYPIITSAEG